MSKSVESTGSVCQENIAVSLDVQRRWRYDGDPSWMGTLRFLTQGKLIFDNMVGLVDGILKFISSELRKQFWEWMDNAI